MARENDVLVITIKWKVDKHGMVEFANGYKIDVRRLEKLLQSQEFRVLLSEEVVRELVGEENHK